MDNSPDLFAEQESSLLITSDSPVESDHNTSLSSNTGAPRHRPVLVRTVRFRGLMGVPANVDCFQLPPQSQDMFADSE